MMISDFVTALSEAESADDAFNQYAPDDNHPDNAIRRANLALYLKLMQAEAPQVMMVMEAPGYRGCRLTGVPVTSRRILLDGLPGISVFGEAQGYQEPHDTGFERVQREQSATIVWNTLAEIQPKKLPLIWNTFPFHPHKADKPLTNRRPRKPEMRQGIDFLNMMIALFQPEQIVAIGNVAHETLTEMGHPCEKVRHPAQGGKNDFVAGLTAIFADL